MNKYKHYKTGNLYNLIGEVVCLPELDCDHLYYNVVGEAKHSETLATYYVLKEQELGTLFVKTEIAQEPLILYKALYGDFGFWLRPKTMFFDEVTKDGKFVKRFTYVPEL